MFIGIINNRIVRPRGGVLNPTYVALDIGILRIQYRVLVFGLLIPKGFYVYRNHNYRIVRPRRGRILDLTYVATRI